MFFYLHFNSQNDVFFSFLLPKWLISPYNNCTLSIWVAKVPLNLNKLRRADSKMSDQFYDPNIDFVSVTHKKSWIFKIYCALLLQNGWGGESGGAMSPHEHQGAGHEMQGSYFLNITLHFWNKILTERGEHGSRVLHLLPEQPQRAERAQQGVPLRRRLRRRQLHWKHLQWNRLPPHRSESLKNQHKMLKFCFF